MYLIYCYSGTPTYVVPLADPARHAAISLYLSLAE